MEAVALYAFGAPRDCYSRIRLIAAGSSFFCISVGATAAVAVLALAHCIATLELQGSIWCGRV